MKRTTQEHLNEKKSNATSQTNLLNRVATIAGLPFKFILQCAKLVTEFVPLVFVNQTAAWLGEAHATEGNPDNSQMTRLLGKTRRLALTPLYHSFKVLHFVGRSITSPQNNVTFAYFTVYIHSEDEVKAAVHYDAATDQLVIHGEIDKPAEERKALGMQVLGVVSTGVFWVITYRLLPPVCTTLIMGTGLTALTATAVTKIIAYAYPNTPAEAANAQTQPPATMDPAEVAAADNTRSELSNSLCNEMRDALAKADTFQTAADEASAKAEKQEPELQFDLQIDDLPTPQDDQAESLRHRHPYLHQNNNL